MTGIPVSVNCGLKVAREFFVICLRLRRLHLSSVGAAGCYSRAAIPSRWCQSCIPAPHSADESKRASKSAQPGASESSAQSKFCDPQNWKVSQPDTLARSLSKCCRHFYL